MKINLPVTGREREMREGSIIVSKTDLKGRITFINETFCEISGFSRDELIGASHNIVRHPDMPPEAFEDLWHDLKEGLPWTGLVKNRCKNGDHYWVSANVTPEVVNGKVVGYLSVRTKPARATIEQVDPIYKAVRDGKAEGMRIEHGGVVMPGTGAALQRRAARLGARLHNGLACALLVVAFGVQAAGFLWPALGILLAGVLWVLWAMNQDGASGIQLEQALDRIVRAQYDGNHMPGADRWGRMLGSIRAMQAKLLFVDVESRVTAETNSAAFHEVTEIAGLLVSACGQVDAASQDMTSASVEQSAAAEEVTTAVEETSSQIKANADAANAAHQLVAGASVAATSGTDKMNAMVIAMGEINDSAREIAKIIKVIDEIAFQTNLLALNAAVEAARAGQHGRGFAVVAQEVRNLAGRSAKAAKETTALIEDSIRQVETGVSIADDTSMVFDRIVGDVVKIKDLVAEIAAASQEQSRGVEQINIAITQVAQGARKGNTQAETLATTFADMVSIVNHLRQSVSQIRLT